MICWISGWKHKERNLGTVVQRWTWDQGRRTPWVHRGSAETRNCSGKTCKKKRPSCCLCVYFCTGSICFYECKHTTLLMPLWILLSLSFTSVLVRKVKSLCESQEKKLKGSFHKWHLEFLKVWFKIISIYFIHPKATSLMLSLTFSLCSVSFNLLSSLI